MNIKFLLVAGVLCISTLCFAKQIPMNGDWKSKLKSLAKGTLRNVTIQVKNTFCKALAQGNLEYTNNYNFYAQ